MATATPTKTDAQRILLRAAELIEERGFWQSRAEDGTLLDVPKCEKNDPLCAFLATAAAASDLGLGDDETSSYSPVAEADALLFEAAGLGPYDYTGKFGALRAGFRWNDRTPGDEVVATIRRAAE